MGVGGCGGGGVGKGRCGLSTRMGNVTTGSGGRGGCKVCEDGGGGCEGCEEGRGGCGVCGGGRGGCEGGGGGREIGPPFELLEGENLICWTYKDGKATINT